MNMGSAIRLFRVQAGLKQIDLAESSGISSSYLSLLERGKRDMKFSTALKICNALDVPFLLLVYASLHRDEIDFLSKETRGELFRFAILRKEGFESHFISPEGEEDENS